MHLHRGSGQMMDEAGLVVNPDVQFHATRPWLPLACSLHLRVPWPRLILGGGGSIDQGSIHDRALPQAEAQARPRLRDQRTNARAQGVRFPEVPELAQRGFIRHPCCQGQPDKMAQAQGGCHFCLGSRVRQVIPLGVTQLNGNPGQTGSAPIPLRSFAIRVK